jgi:uncharacterized protein YceH (UPF0502 family)
MSVSTPSRQDLFTGTATSRPANLNPRRFSGRFRPAEPAMTDEAPVERRPLTFEETRILGCLIEKELTTPDHYPLTLNALVSACNQTTNREPVVNYAEAQVLRALERLKSDQWVFQIQMAGARVPKYRHNAVKLLEGITKPGLALLSTLLLRGPQTVGELRQRTERMHTFKDLADTEDALTGLIANVTGPLVACFLPGQGRRVSVYAHLLSGEVDTPEMPATQAAPAPEPSTDIAEDENEVPGDWKVRMEAEIELLKREVARLKQRLDDED